MHYIKRVTAVLMAAMLILLVMPLQAKAEPIGELERLLLENPDDPGAERLSGRAPLAFFDEGVTSETEFSNNDYLSLEKAGVTGVLSPFKGDLLYYHTAHPDHLVLHGVDVSTYQRNVDWKKAKAAGVDFAIVRVAYRGYGAEGNLKTDSYYKEHLAAATAVGIKTGVYIYSQATTQAEAIEEANYVLALIKGYEFSLPVVLDFEYASVNGKDTGRLYNANLSRKAATDVCLAFCLTIEEAGYVPMVYANKSMLSSDLHADWISYKWPVWLAHYTQDSNYAGEFDFWQYTQSGAVNGMSGNIDCNFWYIDAQSMKIDLPEETVLLDVGESMKVKAALTPSYKLDPVEWTSSNPKAATVDVNGVVKGVGTGKTVITATLGDLTDSREVSVGYHKVKSVTLNDDAEMLEVGDTYQLKETVLPTTAVDKSVTWTSSNTSVAAVDETGKVTAVGEGEATITVKTNNGGFTDSCKITVGLPVTSITLSKSSLEVSATWSEVVTATIKPDNGSIKWKAVWSSANSGIAAVDQSGKITGVAPGKTTITATAGSKSATLSVTVLPKPIAFSTAVKLSGVSSHSKATVNCSITNMSNTSAKYSVQQVKSQGSIALMFTLPHKTHKIEISRAGYTSYIDNSFVVGTDTLPSSVTLYAGDVNGDGYVNAKDYAALRDINGTSNANGDFDLSGKVDGTDSEILLDNFGKNDTQIG